MEIKNEISKLAEMMQREFGAAQKRSEALESKMDNKIDALDNKVNGLDNKVDRLDNKVDRLEGKMDERFDEVDERFNEVLNREDKIFKTLGDLETDNTMGAGASRRQEDRLENHEERIVVAEEKLGIDSAV